MEPGTKIIIRQNPHHINAENILGTVAQYRKGAGFMGVDLVDVEYVDPGTGETHVMPFGIYNLDSAEPAHLIALAERYVKLAAEMRKLASKSS